MKRRIAHIILAAVLVIVASVAVIGFFGSRPVDAATASASIGSLLERTVFRDSGLLHGVLLVDAPRLGVQESWSAGLAYSGTDEPMTIDHAFASASVGKLFTAATVLDQVDRGAFGLDSTLGDLLPPSDWSGLPRHGGDVESVTVAELLSHRSGLPDYFEGETSTGAPTVMELMALESDRSWTVPLLFDYLRTNYDTDKPLDAEFNYADTNYDLLGRILEESTGHPWFKMVRTTVLEPAGLSDSWFHNTEEPPHQPMAALHIGDVDISTRASKTLDGAGGGLATTAADLRDFIRWIDGADGPSLERFGEVWTEDAIAPGIDYGYGLWRIRPEGLSFMLRGLPTIYGASGSTGSYAYVIPEWDAVITGTFDDSDYGEKHVMFLVRVLMTLGRIEAE